MRIGVTYDLKSDYLALGYSDEDAAEFDSDITIEAICAALTDQGWQVSRIGHVKNLVEKLARGERWDAVFNFCEGLKGISREAQVPAILEAYDIPYVFSDPLTLAVTLDKAMAKRVARDQGVPTADFAVIEKIADVARIKLPYPLFLKPVAEGSGKGINAKSRVMNLNELTCVATDLLKRFAQPVLAETFLPGREFTVGIVGTGDSAEVLGVSEIHQKSSYIGYGYGFDNKNYWEDKVDILEADAVSAKAAGEVALAAWRALRCRDGGRIDIRNDEHGKPHFIEVNPLAGLRPDYSDLCFIAKYRGLSYPQLIARIMDAFLERHPHLIARAGSALCSPFQANRKKL